MCVGPFKPSTPKAPPPPARPAAAPDAPEPVATEVKAGATAKKRLKKYGGSAQSMLASLRIPLNVG